MAIKMQQFQDLLLKFSEAFYSDNFKNLLSLEEKLIKSCEDSLDLKTLLDSNLEYNKFKEDSQFFQKALSYLRSNNWEVISNNNEIIVETCCSGADFYARSSVLINSGILETLSVISEIDLLSTW